jgi:hypothetical protein
MGRGGDALMLVHSGAVLVVCVVLDAGDEVVGALCLAGVLVYALHTAMLVAEGEGASSMVVHHLLAIAIQSIFWWHADSPEHPLAQWKIFAWTELGSTLHKCSPFIPDFRTWRWKRWYQALYLACYLVTYALIIVWLAGRSPHHHATRTHLLGVPTEAWHAVLIYGLVALLIYWWCQSLAALRHVLADMRRPHTTTTSTSKMMMMKKKTKKT